MIFGKNAPGLIVSKGANAGKSIALKKKEVRIGSGDDCQVKVSGRYISPLHAVLHDEGDGLWTLENHSINGTLVNGQSVKTVTLNQGDSIVVGGALEFEFSTGAKVKPTAKADAAVHDGEVDEGEGEAGDEAAKPSGGGKRMGLLIGLAAYGIGLVVLAVFLSLYDSVSGGAGPLKIERVPEVMDATRYELARAAGFSDAEPASCALDRGHDGFDRAHGAAAGDNASGLRSDDVERILSGVEQEFHEAWRLEMQGHYQRAGNHYRKVFELLPGVRYCAVRLAAARLRVIQELGD